MADKTRWREFTRLLKQARRSIAIVEGAKALALLRGRRYALPEDMTDLVPDVMRHRVVLSYEALAEMAARVGADLVATGHTFSVGSETCIGCHETPNESQSRSVRTTLKALQRPPSLSGPQPGEKTGQRALDYAMSTRDVHQLVGDIKLAGLEKALWMLSGKFEGTSPAELDLKGRVLRADKELFSLEAAGRAMYEAKRAGLEPSLVLGLVPPDRVAGVLDNLVKDVRAHGNLERVLRGEPLGTLVEETRS